MSFTGGRERSTVVPKRVTTARCVYCQETANISSQPNVASPGAPFKVRVVTPAPGSGPVHPYETSPEIHLLPPSVPVKLLCCVLLCLCLQSALTWDFGAFHTAGRLE